MRVGKLIRTLVCVFILSETVAAQEPWVLQKNKNGIKVSNRHAANSSFNDIRVEADLPGNVDQLSAILLDIARYTEWAYATKKSVLIKEQGPGKLIYYSEIEVPWPATNRYFYAGFELKKNTENHSVEVTSANLPDYGPVPKDLVKVPFSRGTWHITTLSKNSIHVDYILQLNPGGSTPAWVLNMFSSKGPLETFENIRKKLLALNPK